MSDLTLAASTECCNWPGCGALPPLNPFVYEKDGKLNRFYFCRPHYEEARHGTVAPGRDVDEMIEKMYGARFKHASFDTYITDEAYFARLSAANPKISYSAETVKQIRDAKTKVERFARTAVETRHGSCLLCGSPGGGKTHLGAAAARLFIENGLVVSRWTGVRLLLMIRHTYSSNYAEQQQTVQGIISDMLRADAIMIDDLRESCFARDVRDYLFEIIDGVYSKNRILFISTNFSIQELASDGSGPPNPEPARLGSAAVDRLLHPPSELVDLIIPSMRVTLRQLDKANG